MHNEGKINNKGEGKMGNEPKSEPKRKFREKLKELGESATGLVAILTAITLVVAIVVSFNNSTNKLSQSITSKIETLNLNMTNKFDILTDNIADYNLNVVSSISNIQYAFRLLADTRTKPEEKTIFKNLTQNQFSNALISNYGSSPTMALIARNGFIELSDYINRVTESDIKIAQPQFADWSTSGVVVSFSAKEVTNGKPSENSRIFIFDFITNKIFKITDPPDKKSDVYPRWNPIYPSRLLFCRERSDSNIVLTNNDKLKAVPQYDIYLVDIEKNDKIIKLIDETHGYNNVYPTWEPTLGEIVVFSSVDTISCLYNLNAFKVDTTNNQSKVSIILRNRNNPLNFQRLSRCQASFSPNGQYLALSIIEPHNKSESFTAGDIFLLRLTLKGNEIIIEEFDKLVDSIDDEICPNWSPDSKNVIFSYTSDYTLDKYNRPNGNNYQLLVYNVETKKIFDEEFLIKKDHSYTYANWQPRISIDSFVSYQKISDLLQNVN